MTSPEELAAAKSNGGLMKLARRDHLKVAKESVAGGVAARKHDRKPSKERRQQDEQGAGRGHALARVQFRPCRVVHQVGQGDDQHHGDDRFQACSADAVAAAMHPSRARGEMRTKAAVIRAEAKRYRGGRWPAAGRSRRRRTALPLYKDMEMASSRPGQWMLPSPILATLKVSTVQAITVAEMISQGKPSPAAPEPCSVTASGATTSSGRGTGPASAARPAGTAVVAARKPSRQGRRWVCSRDSWTPTNWPAAKVPPATSSTGQSARIERQPPYRPMTPKGSIGTCRRPEAGSRSWRPEPW